MSKKHPPYCPPMQHEFAAHQETHTPWSYGYYASYSARTLLFCKKCGLHFYVDKTPADYASTASGITWNYTLDSAKPDPILSGTIVYDGENRCQ